MRRDPRHRRTLHRVDSGLLGTRELVAIAVGGMIGGGIFSILGLAAQIAGHAAPLALAVGAVVAGAAGYSYAKLALAFPRDGASYTYLQRAFPTRPVVASVTGWAVVLGYVGTLALYAFTFGAYASDLLGHPGSVAWRVGLGLAVISAFVVVNLAGVREAGIVEDVIVYGKLAILAFVGAVGLSQVRPAALTPMFDRGVGAVFVAGALIFVAYEGFQLTTNAVQETEDPRRTLPRAIYLSIAVVGAVYVTLAYVAVGTLSIPELVAAEEYALAVVARPVLGNLGHVLVGVAAMFATSSAINSTLFGASRLVAEMADTGSMPEALGVRTSGNVPAGAVVAMAVPAAVLMLAGSLSLIAAFSSMTFLLVSAAVSVANLRLRSRTGAQPRLVWFGLALMGTTIVLLVGHLVATDVPALVGIAAGYAVAVALEEAYRRRRPSHGST